MSVVRLMCLERVPTGLALKCISVTVPTWIPTRTASGSGAQSGVFSPYWNRNAATTASLGVGNSA